MFFRQYSEQEFSFAFSDVPIRFGKLGINEITHLKAFTTDKEYTLSTDWISPYNAGTMIDGQPQGNHKACGGNHGTVGGGGYPTANNRKTTIEELGEKEYRVEVVNEITVPANIGADGVRNSIDLIEKVTYLVTDNDLGITVELESLTDVYINWYLGLQATRAGWDGSILFHNDPVNTSPIEIGDSTINSGTKAQSPNIDRVTMTKGDYSLSIRTSPDYGIGYTHIRDTDPICYLQGRTQTNSGKFYWHLVKNNNLLKMPAGTKVSYKGGYTFKKER